MTKEYPLNEFQLALRNFKKNHLAFSALWILALLYLTALGADFLSPYSYNDEDRRYSYCPPTLIQWVDHGKLTWPFVNTVQLTFNEIHARVYVTDESQKFPLKLFIKTDEYKLFNLLPCRRHLFGVEFPGRLYLLGADSRGRDVFSRLMYGGRISLSIGLLGVLISFSIGLIVGGIAGFYGGRIDNILMRLCEMVMMVPGFYLLLALRAAVPDNFNSVQIYLAITIILSFLGWAGLARIIRGMCLSLREREFVAAARTLGASDFKIILNHILPHTLSYSIFAVMLSIPGYILGESALSLIGLGIQDPYASWGNMLSEAMGIARIKFTPWILWPAFFIFLTVISFNVVGDALRDSMDPMLKNKDKS